MIYSFWIESKLLQVYKKDSIEGMSLSLYLQTTQPREPISVSECLTLT